MEEKSGVLCPVCRTRFDLEGYLDIGDTLSCPTCSANLEVTSVDPPRVEEVMSEDDKYDYTVDNDRLTKRRKYAAGKEEHRIGGHNL